MGRKKKQKHPNLKPHDRLHEGRVYHNQGERFRKRDAAERMRHLDKFRAALADGKYDTKKFRICRDLNHIGLERKVLRKDYNQDTKCCCACNLRRNYHELSLDYLRKVKMAREALIDAIANGRLGTGTLKDFYHEGLAAFDGIKGIVRHIKSEYDAADEGSQLRKQYLEMFVKVMVALSTMGQEEDVEQLNDDEVAARVLAMRTEAAEQFTQESAGKDA